MVANPTTASAYQDLPVDSIRPSPHQARIDFNPEELRNLAASMREEKLLQPIVVRPVDTGYELISGERRLRAAKLLRWKTIEAKVIKTANDAEAAAKGLVENLQRENLNPIEKAKGYQHLAELGLTQTEVAKRVGLSQPTIAKHIALLALPTEIQQIIPRGIISEGHIRFLAKLKNRDMQIRMAQQADREGWSIKETERQIKSFLAKYSSKVRAKAVPEPIDPLAESWRYSPTRSEGEWGIKYARHAAAYKGRQDFNAWMIWVGNFGKDPRAAMVKWLNEMLSLLHADAAAAKADKQQKKGQAAEDEFVGLFKWLEPKTPKERAAQAKDDDRQRLPRTPAQLAEYEALVPAGPSAVFAWMFGKDGYYDLRLRGKTWAELGVTDSRKMGRRIVKEFELVEKLMAQAEAPE